MQSMLRCLARDSYSRLIDDKRCDSTEESAEKELQLSTDILAAFFKSPRKAPIPEMECGHRHREDKGGKNLPGFCLAVP